MQKDDEDIVKIIDWKNQIEKPKSKDLKEYLIDKMKINYDRSVRDVDFKGAERCWLLDSEKKKGFSPKLTKTCPFQILTKIV